MLNENNQNITNDEAINNVEEIDDELQEELYVALIDSLMDKYYDFITYTCLYLKDSTNFLFLVNSLINVANQEYDIDEEILANMKCADTMLRIYEQSLYESDEHCRQEFENYKKSKYYILTKLQYEKTKPTEDKSSIANNA